LLTGLALAALAVRTFDLGTVPRWFTDEGLWAMPPRDFVLFGYWTLGPSFHFYLSPLYAALLVPWFGGFGAGIVQARVMDALLGAAVVGEVFWLGRTIGLRPGTSLAAAALVAFDGPSIITNRSVLLESLQSALLLGCAIAAVSHWRLRRPLLAILIASALTTKLLSAYMFPALLLYAWWRHGRRFAIQDGLALLGAVVLTGGMFGLIALSDPHNFLSTWRSELSIRAVGVAYEEATSIRSTLMYFLTRAPLILICLVGSIGWLAVRRRVSAATGFLALWSLIGIAAMSAQGYTPPRYFVPLIPFVWLWVMANLEEMRAPSMHLIVPGVVLAAALFTTGSLVGYYYVLGNRDTSGPAVVGFLDTVVRPGERVLAPLEYVVSTRTVALGIDSAPRSFTSGHLVWDEVLALDVRYVVIAPDSPQRPTVPSEADRYLLLGEFGQVRVFQVVR
jgi:hypothetical protein